MARTPSTMLDLGTPAPDFTLLEPATGKQVSLADFTDKPLLVAFICNHCPYVKHIQAEFTRFAAEYQDKGLAIVGINSNDVASYPDDSPEKMIEEIERVGYPFPYLYDETQEVAKTYKAACTPDFFLFDAEHRLVYRGQFDEARPRSDTPVTGKDMRSAVDALLAGEAITIEQVPSLGCNIKWKAGNEPAYYAA
jgi:thiol-disulfide isomerase/thioredoxin